jgi:pectin methylesterase-like acyl-CoA thioesterase
LLTVSKPNIVLLGATPNASDVVITYDNASGTVKPDGSGTYGTTGSATVLIKGSNVTTRNLTIENAYQETGSGSEQAVALKTSGDRLVFDNVRLLGDQDTLYVDSPTQGALARSYFTNSYIEGDVDFIFGRGTAVFDRSTLKAATRGSATNNGYVTAASTDKSLTYGYLITDSTIVSDAPAQSFSLGRPWQPSGDVNAVAQVVIRNTNLPAAIKSSPWTDMTSNFSWRDARLAEYQNIGAGAGVNADRPQLSDADAAKYTKFTYLEGSDGWNPTGQAPPAPPADLDAPAAPAALVATAGDSKAVITWAANTEADLAGYNLYRTITATPDAGSTRLNGALLTGTTYSDVRLANDTAYGYTVTAVDKAGNESAASAASTVTPVGVPLPAHDILVAADGSGQYTSVQAAVAAAPTGTAAKPTVVAIKPGIYTELVAVSKSYVQLVGTTGDAFDVTLTYDNAAGTSKPDGTGTYGTGGSQSVLVSGSNVTVRNLTIENSFDEAAFTYSAEQAVALKTTGDRLVFDNVRLLGNQDTLLADSPDAPVIARSYFTNSFIQGDVDFIFGRGTAVFDKTTINALSRGSNSNNGYLTAASTSDKNPYGFLITDSTITSNAPAGTFSLGRPWRGWTDGYTKNGVAYNSRGQVTIRNSVLPAAIRVAQPWADMSPNVWTDGRFSEYANTGAGAGMNVNRPQLSDEQAAVSTKFTYLAGADGWNPTGDSARIPVLVTPPVASTDLTAPTGVATVVAKNAVIVTWDAVAGADVAGYAVYRSAAGEAPTKVSGAAPLTGTSYTDPTGIIGTEYQYTVTAVAASGAESPASKPAAGTSVKADILVAADGSGDATTVQAGINLLADNADYTAQGGRVILIKPGTYTGVVTSGNRYGVTLVGSTGKPEDVVLTAAGTGTAATVTLSGKGWSLRNLTVANTNGATTAGAQATALNVSAGDKDVFDNVRFLGDKQTLIVSTANVTTYSRLYFHSVYVEGGSDMILGRAVAVFTNSTFHVLNRPGASLTDSSIAAGSPYGFLIADSTIVTDGAAGSVYLGRPYGTNGKAQVAIRNTELGAGINTAKPWKDWDATTTWTAGRFAEYQNIGPGAVITDPATRPQLAAADAGTYTAQAYLSGADGWNPVP